MTQSQYRAREMRAKTHEVVEYDHDDSKPGKPLHIMIPGGLIALATLGLIVFIAYRVWLDGTMEKGIGLTLIGILSPFYVGGVFLFSYGYELYNIPRAIRLTAIIVFVTLAAVVILAVLFFVLGESKGGSSSSSKSSSSSSSKSKSSGKSSSSERGVKGGLIAGAAAKNSSSRSSRGGDIWISGGGGATRTVTKEVVKEVPKEPMPIKCPFCSRSYIPVDFKFACPHCGAATPKDLIEDSQVPKA
jgi:hypothetical protein